VINRAGMARNDLLTLRFIVCQQRFWIRAKGNPWTHADHEWQPLSSCGARAFPGKHAVIVDLSEDGLDEKFKNRPKQMNTKAARSISYRGYARKKVQNGRTGIRAYSCDGSKSYIIVEIRKKVDADVIVYSLNTEPEEGAGASSLYSQQMVSNADINDSFALGVQI
jgi:hypothetical protein